MMLATFFMIFLLIKTPSSYEVPNTEVARTFQSKTLVSQNSTLAVDGSRHTCSMITGVNKTEHAWWRMVLAKPFLVYKIELLFKPDEAIAPHYWRYLSAYVSDNEENPENNLCTMYRGSVKPEFVNEFVTLLCDEPISGKIITIKKYGNFFYPMMFCEVKVFATGLMTVSLRKATEQPGMFDSDTKLLNTVDGNNKSCTRVYTHGEPAWWRVLLGEEFYIYRIIINFKQTAAVTEDHIFFLIYVSNDDDNYKQNVCADVKEKATSKSDSYIDVLCAKPNPLGKIVSIEKYRGTYIHALILCEVTVIANLSKDEENQLPGEFAYLCNPDDIRCDIVSRFFCLPNTTLCDNIRDCPNGIDEVNCTCQQGDFKCLDGLCIPGEWLCDNIKDCQFGEDEEQNCNILCLKEEFECVREKQCIDKMKHCDGHKDCGDNSDEEDCFDVRVISDDNPGYVLLATYRGSDGYYVCKTNWNTQKAIDMCHYLTGRDLGAFRVFTPSWNTNKVIELKNDEPFDKSIPSLNRFEKTYSCEQFVELTCDFEALRGKTQCGTRGLPDEKLGPYILNGNIAKVGAWPWQVEILFEGRHKCGGTIIDDRWILTAAHCSRKRTESDLTVKVGSIKFEGHDVESIGVTHIINHPDNVGFKNDIGLLRLSKPIKFSKTVGPICLPKTTLKEENLKSFRYCVMTGFGTMNRDRILPEYLMQGRANLMTNSECAKNLANIGGDTEDNYLKALKDNNLICAGSVPTRDGINACWGDNGGPLVCKNKFNVWYQVAILDLFERGKLQEECTNSILTKLDPSLHYINLGRNCSLTINN